MSLKSRWILGATVLLATACTSLIGVRDIDYDANAEGGPGGSSSESSGNPPGVVPPGTDGGDGSTSCAADLTTDPANCGACGHDCLGAKCTASLCEPIPIATGLDNPTGIAVDATHIYVSLYNADTIARFPKGGGAIETLATGQESARGVLVDGPTLYWSNSDFVSLDGGGGNVGGVWKCTIASCAATKTFIAGGDFAQNVKLIDGFLVYAQLNDSKVSRIAKTGGARKDFATPNRPYDVTADGTHLYYNSDQENIRRVLFDGGSDEAFAPLDPAFNAKGYIISDATRLYFGYTDGNNKGQVLSAPFEPIGSPKITYGTDNKPTVGMAVDDTFLYWTVEDQETNGNVLGTGGELRACKKTGCAGAPISVIKSLTGGVVTTDDKAVYFAETGVYGMPLGKIWKIAKPLP